MRTLPILLLIFVAHGLAMGAAEERRGIRVKDLCRVVGVRTNSLVGYGIVTGLAGTGDSIRSRATLQSIANTLLRFGVKVDPEQIRSRNVAAVTVTATLPAFSRPGDMLDANVTSIGDARSLVGGTLVRTHLEAANGRTYALVQGPVSVGGYTYDLNGNVVQKNHPTSGVVANGAMVERPVSTQVVSEEGFVELKLHNPDFTTAGRISQAVNRELGSGLAHAIDAGRVRVRVPQQAQGNQVAFLMRMEGIPIVPDQRAVVVINERTGTVVSGGDVRISQVTISHGDLKVSIVTDFLVSQPLLVRQVPEGVRTQVVPDTKIDVREESGVTVSLPAETTVADLVAALRKVKTDTRDVITILQAMRRAGALYAELVVQ